MMKKEHCFKGAMNIILKTEQYPTWNSAKEHPPTEFRKKECGKKNRDGPGIDPLSWTAILQNGLFRVDYGLESRYGY